VADVDWDSWLDRLIEDEAARIAADVRTYLIAEIRQAISNSDALRANDADRLAEIAVDSMIAFSRKNHIRPS
jgi:ketosteroid isomerase-like protein